MSDIRPRPIPVPDPRLYVSALSVLPEGEITVHVTSPGEYVTSILPLGPQTVTLPPDVARTRTEPLVEQMSSGASPYPIRPGSYVWVDGVPPQGPELTVGAWVRPWRLPTIDVVQWAWSAVVSDFDYPYQCRFCLLIDHSGRVGFYIGEGAFTHDNLVLTDVDVGSRLGEWVHLAASVDAAGSAVIYLDGEVAARGGPLRLGPSIPTSRIRLGASAEGGLVDGFLDADMAQAFVAEAAFEPRVLADLSMDRALSPLSEILPPESRLWGTWSFSDPSDRFADVSDAGHQGEAVNEPVAALGGPAYDPADGGPDYDPDSDPSRGSAVRFASDDLVDAGWPAALTWRVPHDAPSGIYAARLQLRGQGLDEAAHAPFVVSRRTPRQSDSVALLCATNTWLAYGRRPRSTRTAAGLESSLYSRHMSGNPFFHVGVRVPMTQLDPFGYESARAERTNHSHLVRTELCAQAWLENRGMPYEMVTDSDLHAEPELLERFKVLLIAGHNEYWTDEMSAGIDAYLRDGGQVVSLSGDTGHWRVTFDEEVGLLESRKVVEGPDSRWLTPDNWGDRWHCHGGGAGGGGYIGHQTPHGKEFVPLLDRSVHRILGAETQGMIDDGTPTAFSGFSVVEPDHFLFHRPIRVPIPSDGRIGVSSLNGPAASGYEFDATAVRLGLEETLPPGLTVLASAFGQRNLEWNGVQSDHGGDILYWERPTGGRVFVVGSIGATGGIVADQALGDLVANAMHHFGVPTR